MAKKANEVEVQVEVEVVEVSEVTIREITITASSIVGMSKDDAFDVMHDMGLKFSECNKVWTALGTKNKGGVFDRFLSFCEEAPQTQSAMSDFLMSDSSSLNELRWFNQRDSIRKLSVAVFVKLGVEFVEVTETVEQEQTRVKMVKTLDDSNKAKKAAADKLKAG